MLVIAEAPPWRAAGEPSYVYKPADDTYEGGILGALVGGVGAIEGSAPNFVKKDAAAKAAVLKYLGERGVLLVDPLPFSLQYSKCALGKHSNLRGKKAYAEAARHGWDEVLQQLCDANVTIHPDVVVGFTLLKSAQALIDSEPLRLPGGQLLGLDAKERTFTTSAGYPDRNQLKALLERTPLPSTNTEAVGKSVAKTAAKVTTAKPAAKPARQISKRAASVTNTAAKEVTSQQTRSKRARKS